MSNLHTFCYLFWGQSTKKIIFDTSFNFGKIIMRLIWGT